MHHTSASLIITENADPDVHRDLETIFQRLAPEAKGVSTFYLLFAGRPLLA
ncbi:MAG: YjbQ family protein [Cocleimonas sp.]